MSKDIIREFTLITEDQQISLVHNETLNEFSIFIRGGAVWRSDINLAKRLARAILYITEEG